MMLGGGTHTQTLSVRDAAGNQSQTSITITIHKPPEPTVAIVIVPRARVVTPFPPLPTAGSPLDPGLGQNQPAQLAFINEPPETRGFSVSPENQAASAEPVSAQTTASPVVWGGAAVGLIGAAMVVAMEAQRKRKEEEARQIAEMHRLEESRQDALDHSMLWRMIILDVIGILLILSLAMYVGSIVSKAVGTRVYDSLQSFAPQWAEAAAIITSLLAALVAGVGVGWVMRSAWVRVEALS